VDGRRPRASDVGAGDRRRGRRDARRRSAIRSGAGVPSWNVRPTASVLCGLRFWNVRRQAKESVPFGLVASAVPPKESDLCGLRFWNVPVKESVPSGLVSSAVPPKVSELCGLRFWNVPQTENDVCGSRF